MDVDTIQPGEDFVERIEQTVASCDVLIVVIGKNWLGATNPEGRIRIADQDFVHLEIRAALERKIRVVPALVGGASMPASRDLPESLSALARRQAIEIVDKSFHQNVSTLINVLEQVLFRAEGSDAGIARTTDPIPDITAKSDVPSDAALRPADSYGSQSAVLASRTARWWVMGLVGLFCVGVAAVLLSKAVSHPSSIVAEQTSHTGLNGASRAEKGGEKMTLAVPSGERPIATDGTTLNGEHENSTRAAVTVSADAMKAGAAFAEGLALYKQKQYSTAVRKLTEAIRLKPTYAEAYCYRGLAYNELKQWKHAISDFDQAIRLGPNLSFAYRGRGEAFGNLNDFTQAVRDLNRAIQIDPKDAEAYTTLATISYDGLHQQQRGVQYLKKALALNSNFAPAVFSQGVIYLDQNRCEPARQSFERAIQLTGGEVNGYMGRGRAYACLKQFDRALQDANQAIQLNPLNPGAYTARARTYADLQQFDRAVVDYNRAIQLDPAAKSAYDGRSAAYFFLKQFESALQDVNKAIELDPSSAMFYTQRGMMYNSLEQPARAIQDFDKALQLNRNYLDAYVYRATAKAALGDQAGAAVDRERAKHLQ